MAKVVQDALCEGQISFFDIPAMPQAPAAMQSDNFFCRYEDKFSDEEIHNILRFGSNTTHSRAHIVDTVQTSASIPAIGEILKRDYHGGYGIVGASGRYCAWYAQDGIHLSRGASARYTKTARIVTWTEAATRIRKMVAEGTFTTADEIAGAEDVVKAELAVNLYNLYRDMSAYAHEDGYLSCFSFLGDRLYCYEDAAAAIKEKLYDESFIAVLKQEFADFCSAYKEDRQLLRWHYHKVPYIEERVNRLGRPRHIEKSTISQMPEIKSFITEDEIDENLAGGSGYSRGKNRIYAYYKQGHKVKEFAGFIKSEYGTGGRSHALSHADGSGENHDSKGIQLQKEGCEKVILGWEQIAKRIGELIRNNRYITEEELKEDLKDVG